ncbi:prohibitin family protein [Salmonella enterica]|nr:prohibitin family protein [Salmonella enterica]EBL7042143.1 prohibitin family protein [Salmonella enterica]HAV7961521.1 prohibitin family protein [Escherichia coli]
MGIKAGISLGGVVLVGLVGLSTIFGSWYTIDQAERGVVLRNGKIVDTAGPGLHFKLPFIMDVVKISTQTHKAKFPKLEAYSNDQQPADINVSVNYSVSPGRVADVYASSKDLEALVSRVLNSSIPEQTENTFGRYTAVSVVQNREKFVADLNLAMRKKLQSMNSPLVIESVNVENISFSDKYDASVEANMQAEVAINTRRQNLETEKVNADIERTKAQGLADAQLAAAKAEAESLTLKGNAVAAVMRMKGQALRENPELTQLAAIEKWDGMLPKQQVPGSTVPFVKIQ